MPILVEEHQWGLRGADYWGSAPGGRGYGTWNAIEESQFRPSSAGTE